ncbi:hypothetical protein [Bradyrhizobium sp. CCBAU 51765]|uniref:hypothetical protein n=1 Tax=Bradyrhizobium sp. CCBAU 51765 TaxID=1325102 RepID=UPI001887E0E3|nr:hypothetical protein [Bradyrhizobium sp. CCBAU 51765]
MRGHLRVSADSCFAEAGDVAYRKILPFVQQRQAALLRLLTEAEREQLWTITERLIVHVGALSDADVNTEIEP